jgi:hypothetical protein
MITEHGAVLVPPKRLRFPVTIQFLNAAPPSDYHAPVDSPVVVQCICELQCAQR